MRASSSSSSSAAAAAASSSSSSLHPPKHGRCLEAHCPTSALDWDEDATTDSCLADVNNLAGFVSRKRPAPQYEHAAAYYTAALGLVPTHCPSLGYYAELHVAVGNLTAAHETALKLCAACGGSLSSLALQIAASFGIDPKHLIELN